MNTVKSLNAERNKMKKLVILFLLLYVAAAAQSTGNYYNPKDDQFRLLGLKRAKEQFESAESEFKRQQQLFDKGMISSSEFERAQSLYADAEVNYQQALLAVIFENQYVSVINAVKYQKSGSRKFVRLTLSNTSSGGGEFKKLINVDDELFSRLQPDIINNIYVSLLNDEGAIISQPYEKKINILEYGKPVTITFELLQDVDVVTVGIVFGNGSQRAPKIFLQKDASVNKVVFQSDQFSQEVELGTEANYSMTLELFSGSENTYKLATLNLPKQINAYFKDPISDARLSQFRFNEQTQTREAELEVFLPDRPGEQVKIDSTILFYVVAIPAESGDLQQIEKDKVYSEKEIKSLGLGYLKLELVPRGVGELKVRIQQLYFSVKQGDSVSVPIILENEGTRRLDNIEFDIDLPLNWQKKIEPAVIPSLDIRKEYQAVLTVFPPPDITVGKYDIRFATTSLSDDLLKKSEDKTITIEVQQEANIFGTLIIVLLIIGILSGIVIFGIRLTKK